MRSTLAPLPLILLAACASGPSSSGTPDLAGTPGADLGAAAGADLAGAPTSQSFSLAPFMLGPGEEKINCYYVPPDGTERNIGKFTVDMNAGSHHLVVFRIEDPTGLPATGPLPCTQIDVPMGLSGMLPGAQQLHSEYQMPDGVAFKLSKTSGLYFQSHYINASPSDTITTQVTYKIDLIDAAKVQQEAGMVFWSQWGLKVPVGMSTQSQTCKFPQDLNLLTATGHMHKHGLTFDAVLDGKGSIYHTANWDEPNAALFPAPGMTIKSGTALTYSCAYNNDSGAQLVFGNSASKNEMCIFAGVYYPAGGLGGTLFNCPK